MNTQSWKDRWWEAAVVALATSSVILGVVAVGNGHTGWAIGTGFAPAALLLSSMAVRSQWPAGAAIAVILGGVAAASWWWMMYPVILAALVIAGGFQTGKIGIARVNGRLAR